MSATLTGELNLMTEEQLCELLAVTSRQLWRDVAHGRIPAPLLRLSRQRGRWRRSEVESWLAGRPPG